MFYQTTYVPANTPMAAWMAASRAETDKNRSTSSRNRARVRCASCSSPRERAASASTFVAADTVRECHDSDWNPQNDVQAMARCHRHWANAEGHGLSVADGRALTKRTGAVATAEVILGPSGLDGMASANAGNRHLHESLLKQGAGAVSFKPHAVNKELDGDDEMTTQKPSGRASVFG